MNQISDIEETKAIEEKVEKKKWRELHIGWNWRLLPLQFVLVVLPLIMYLYMSNSGYTSYPWHSAEDAYSDVFLHGKMVAFMLIAAVTLVLAVLKTIKMDKEERKKKLFRFIPLFIYMGCVILSTICSENISYSVFGSMDAKEPVGVLLGYVIVAFYAYVVIDSMSDVGQLVGAAVVGGACMAFVGVMQTIGKDPFANEAVQRLFVGSDFLNSFGPLQLTFPKGIAYGTLFNPNYVGTYVAMYVPLLLIGFVMYRQIWKKAVCGLSFVGLLVMLFASQSRTGLISVIAVAVMMLIFLGRGVWARWYLVIPGVTFLVMSFLLLDTYRDNLLTNRLKQMFAIEKSAVPVAGIDTTGNGVRVLYKDTEFTVMMPISNTDFAYVVIEDGEQKEITYGENKATASFVLNNGDEITIQTATYENTYAFGLKFNSKVYYFTNQIVVGNYKIINVYGRIDECVIPANVFPDYEAVASGRGYVWGRCIPLLWDYFIVGSGPDTFGIAFPQNDYVARYRSGFTNIIFTRPHNFYLQMGIQTGTLSLIAFLVFYGMYFVGSCRRYLSRKFTKMEEWFGFAMFLCTIGFMASGLANDSLIVVTPVFYVLLGMGMAINHKFCPLEKKTKKSEEEGLE